MKKLLVMGLLVIAGSVHAADWIHITGDDSGGAYFIDKDSVKIDKKNNIISIWVKSEGGGGISSGKKITSTISNTNYYCVQQKTNQTYGISYSYNEVVYSGELTGELSPIIPGTIGETLFKTSCDYLYNSSASSVAADVTTAANEAHYEELFNQAIDEFLSRPENYVFSKGSKAVDILDSQFKKLANDPNYNFTNYTDMLNIARSKTAKLISIPPLPSQKKASKPAAKPKADSRRSVYL